MRLLKRFFEHHFNPLHVYCRLCSVGLKPRTARRLCSVYEKVVYRQQR